MVYSNNYFHYFFINQEEVSTTQEKFKLLQAIIISNDMWLHVVGIRISFGEMVNFI